LAPKGPARPFPNRYQMKPGRYSRQVRQSLSRDG
jgi:hypothetical protein